MKRKKIERRKKKRNKRKENVTNYRRRRKKIKNRKKISQKVDGVRIERGYNLEIEMKLIDLYLQKF